MERTVFGTALVSLFGVVLGAVAFAGPAVMRLAPPAAAAAGARPAAGWSLPVPGGVVRPFVAPISRYGPGHRGVDLVAPAGTPVRAAGDGVVVFAGTVAATRHVVVAHAGDLRTSYSFLQTIAVHVGEAVTRGAVLGTAGGPADDGHPAGVLHLGLRVGDRYVDPMLLFRPPDLSRVVHLAPLGASESSPSEPWGGESHEVSRGLDLGGALGRGLTGALSSADAVLGAVGDGALGALAPTPLGAVATDAARVAGGIAAWVRAREHCTADPPGLDPSGGSGHLLMAVAGIGSASDRVGGATFDLPVEKLGYRADEVSWFSYRADGGRYQERDTWGDLHQAALRLGDQLRASERARPGREVDLIAHSQGGVVVDEFLQHAYRADDPTYPPIGTVVTLSSPHQGAPLASAAREIDATASGQTALRRASAVLGRVADPPPAGSVAVTELAEGSDFMRRLWRHGLPDLVQLTSIGAADDFVVPATQIEVKGATREVVDPHGVVDDHDAMVTDSVSVRAVKAALEDRPPLCTSITTGVRGAVEPVVISRIEHESGHGAAAAGRGVDAVTGAQP